ncbi:hypothetical protein SCREM2_gp174 [Synechococcus phage S-CREM2]|nr:hypothetical protein SCREM2_gp174 [Synechococcus phage S-CREM2]
MTSVRPLSTIVAVDCSTINLATASRVLNELPLYRANKVRVTNLTDKPIAVMRCQAQGNQSDTGNADFIGVEEGFGVGALILSVGETIIIDKEPGAALWDEDAGQYVINPPTEYWGEVIRLDDSSLLANTNAPTTGFIYASAVSTHP